MSATSAQPRLGTPQHPRHGETAYNIPTHHTCAPTRFREEPKIWENASKEKSVEHVFPQKDPYGNWKGKGRQKVKPESFVHRLGNLLVLPFDFNKQAGTKSFAEKVKVYKKFKGLYHVSKVMKLKDWSLAAIEKREKELLKFATEQWWG